MQSRVILPALALSLLATLALAAGRLLPGDGEEGPVLVWLGASGRADRLSGPALADVSLLGMPVPGFAVLRGDRGRIRSVFPLALAWKGTAPCSPTP
jgi:hypothetical protein